MPPTHMNGPHCPLVMYKDNLFLHVKRKDGQVKAIRARGISVPVHVQCKTRVTRCDMEDYRHLIWLLSMQRSSKLLPDGRAPHSISKREPSHSYGHFCLEIGIPFVCRLKTWCGMMSIFKHTNSVAELSDVFSQSLYRVHGKHLVTIHIL